MIFSMRKIYGLICVIISMFALQIMAMEPEVTMTARYDELDATEQESLKNQAFDYIYDGNLPGVQGLLDRGVPINSRDYFEGNTLLIEASQLGHGEIALELIRRGAQINVKNNNGESALLKAAAEGELSIVRALLTAGVEVNSPDQEGKTPLIYAAEYGDNAVAVELLNNGADKDASDNEWKTALIYAAMGSHLDVAQTLIGRGVYVHYQDNTGLRAYDYTPDGSAVEALLRPLTARKSKA